MLLALAELMVVPMLLNRVITTTPPNGDDAGAFTYTLQDSLGNATRWNFSNAGPFYYRFSCWYLYHNNIITITRLCGD
jgi:hypothetical protein